jgi:hypothetical protein
MTTDTLNSTDSSVALSHSRPTDRFYAMRRHALNTARLRSNRARIVEWLTALELPDVDALLDSIDGIRHDTTGATARLVADHQGGCTLATTILLGAKARMLAAVARSAPGDPDERAQVVLEAFLSRALVRVDPAHPYIGQQLYWITLRAVTKTQPARPLDQSGWEEGFDPNAVAGADVAADTDSYVTARVLLDWAAERGVLTEMDRTALELRFTGTTTMRVREVARRLGMPEDRLETRLRRAIRRLRDAAAEDGEDLFRAAVAARWAADQSRGSEKVGAAA